MKVIGVRQERGQHVIWSLRLQTKLVLVAPYYRSSHLGTHLMRTPYAYSVVQDALGGPIITRGGAARQRPQRLRSAASRKQPVKSRANNGSFVAVRFVFARSFFFFKVE